MFMEKKSSSILNMVVFVAALGYFVDIYDLLMFNIVRKPSITALGVTDPGAILSASTHIINLQMIGLLIGGIIWGILGDKKGRLSILFGSIVLYSIANIVTGFAQTIDQYAWARFAAGLGLAGELGAGITLVSELLPKDKRGIGTAFVAGIGLSGAVAAYFVFRMTDSWRLCYFIGGGLGFLLLILRISVAESGMYNEVKTRQIIRGDFTGFFTDWKRFKKYMNAILIGLPTWFCIGILINLSTSFVTYPNSAIDTGKAVMFAYVAISIGDIFIGFLSQWMKSRKKPLYIFYGLMIIFIALFLSPLNNSDTTMYVLSTAIGFAAGYWALFVTMGAEQFGTNLRATAATTIPNMVRGALFLMNLLFKSFFLDNVFHGDKNAAIESAIWTGVIVFSITLVSAYFTEETFGKDLNYVEE
jgi:MFS transporter, putative metabolite:H+ symporter